MGFFDIFKKKPQERVPRRQRMQEIEQEEDQEPWDGLYPLESAVKPWEISQLTQRFVEETRLIPQEGEDSVVNKTALNFMEQGLDMINFAQRSFQIQLTLSEQDIHQVEVMANHAAGASEQGAMDKEQLILFSKLLAGYLGLLISIHKGGQWVGSVSGMEDGGPAICQPGGKHYFVLGKVVRRIQRANEDSLVDFYRSIPYQQSQKVI